MAPIRGRAGYRREGRGRGRGRGGSEGFKTSRLHEDADDSAASSNSDSEIQDEHDDQDSQQSSDNEASAAPTGKAYLNLLQSFQHPIKSDRHKRKRRKIKDAEDDLNMDQENENDAEDLHYEPELAAEDLEDLEDAEEEETNKSDPFEIHFANLDDNLLSRRLQAISEGLWERQTVLTNALGKCITTVPKGDKPLTIRPVATHKQLILKKRLTFSSEDIIPEFSSLQSSLAPFVFEYRDILLGSRTVENAEELRRIVCLHSLNHIFKTRDRIIKNNARISANPDTGLECLDQGFTRPKVLILLETMQTCVRYIDTLMELCDPEQQENRKRFQDVYVDTDKKLDEEKPLDFQELFEGNDSNHFRMGMKFTRKTVKYFSKFYASDIIFASPLGLRHALEPDGKNRKSKDHDFLSSIELVIVDQADAMLAQNWEHVEFVFSHLNLPPQETRDCDFSRVRRWYLDNNAKFLRQTILLSAFLTPEIKGLSSQYMRNVAGKIECQPDYSGSIVSLTLSVKQTFSRFSSMNIIDDVEARFKYFTSAVLPSITRMPKPTEGGQGVLVFIPSYFDFVRVRNYFANSTAAQNISFGVLSEYSEPTEVRRARSHFMTGRHSVMLYTGRAHHFRRFVIRGVKRVIMYQLPDNPRFYEEIVGGFLSLMINEGKLETSEASVRVLFSKFDHLRLERVVGTRRVRSLLTDKGDTFEFI